MLDDEILKFLRAEDVWWSVDDIVEEFHGVDEDEAKAALDRLVSQGVAYRDNQVPPWYAAVEQTA